MGLGTLVPNISSPLIHVRLSGRIREPTKPSSFESPTGIDSCNYDFPLMIFSKKALFRSTRFSCHYCLTVHEPKRRACRLSLAFVGSFVNRAHLLLTQHFHALFCSYKYFPLEHSFTFFNSYFLSILSSDHSFEHVLTSPESFSSLEPKVSFLPFPVSSTSFYKFPLTVLDFKNGLLLSPRGPDSFGRF